MRERLCFGVFFETFITTDAIYKDSFVRNGYSGFQSQ